MPDREQLEEPEPSESDYEIPDVLVDAAAAGQLVVLVGAGASIAAGLPGWSELLQKLKKEATSILLATERDQEARELEEAQSPLLLAALLRDVFDEDNKDNFQEKITAIIQEKELDPGPVHRALAALPRSVFITTNYDRLLERAIEEVDGTEPETIYVDDFEGLRELRARSVLKLHGDVLRPSLIVIAEEDYAQMLSQDRVAWRSRLESLQLERKVLCIGTSLTDPDLSFVANKLKSAFDGAAGGTWWLGTKSLNARRIERDGHTVIQVERLSQIPGWLTELSVRARRKVSSPSILISQLTADLGRRQRAEISDVQGLISSDEFEFALIEVERLERKFDNHNGGSVSTPDDLIEIQNLLQIEKARCLSALQSKNEVAEVLNGIDPNRLSLEDRVRVAFLWASIREVTRAEELISGLPEKLVEETVHKIDIINGNIPREISADSTLQLDAARLDLALGRLSSALHRVTPNFLEDSRLLPRTEAILILVDLYFQSIMPSAESVQRLSGEQLGRIVGELDSCFTNWSTTPEKPRAVRVLMLQAAVRFYSFTSDPSRHDEAWSLLTNEEQLEYSSLHVEIGGRVKDSGPRPSLLPVFREFELATRLAVNGERDSARNRLNDAIKKFGDEGLLHERLADLALEAGEVETALTHARIAFDKLRGRGQRHRLGFCLFKTGELEEACLLLEPLSDSMNREWIRLLVSVIDGLGKTLRASEILRDFIQENPNDGASVIDLSRLMIELGELESGAEMAWKALNLKDAAPLSVASFSRAAFIIKHTHDPEQRRRRLSWVVRESARRWPEEARGLALQLSLAADVGELPEFFPSDWKILREAGLAATVPVSEIPKIYSALAIEHGQANQAWLNGRISYERAGELMGASSRDLIARLLASQVPALSPPIRLIPPANSSLRVGSVLIGSLELHLLAHLGLLFQFSGWLAAGGRHVVLFNDVSEALTVESLFLGTAPVGGSGRGWLHTCERLLASGAMVVVPRISALSAESAHLVEAGSSGEKAWLMSAAASAVLKGGYVDRDTFDKWGLCAEGETPDYAIEIPSHLMVNLAVLALVDDIRFWQSISELIKAPIRLTEEEHAEFIRLRRNEEISRTASEVASDVSRWLSTQRIADRVRLVPRPEHEDLPQVQEGGSVRLIEMRECLARTLSWRAALVSTEDLVLVTGDHSIATLMTTSIGSEWVGLQWTQDSLQKIRFELESVQSRVIGLDSLVKLIATEEEAAKSCRALAQLGFIEAVDEDFILALEQDFANLGGARPQRLLKAASVVANQPRHVSRQMAEYRVAAAVSGAIGRLPKRSSRTGEDEYEIDGVRALLDFVEEVGRPFGFILDQVFVLLFLQGASRPLDVLRVDSESPIDKDLRMAATWRTVRQWVEVDSRRLAALARGMRFALSYLVGDNPDRKLPESALYALLAIGTYGASKIDSSGLRLDDSLLAPLLIMTGALPFDPLDVLSVEQSNEHQIEDLQFSDAIKAGVQLLADQQEYENIARILYGGYGCKLGDIEFAVVAHVPPTALLSHSMPDDRAKLARVMGVEEGPRDGRLFNLLHSIQDEPGDDARLIELAQSQLNSPFLLVSEDPTTVFAWASDRSIFQLLNRPSTIDDLREILNEPGPLPDEPLTEIIYQRFQDFVPWQTLAHNRNFLTQLNVIPGGVATIGLKDRLVGEFADRDALETFGHLDGNAEDLTWSEIYSNVLFLRLMASRRSVVSYDGNSVNLGRDLPGVLERLLAHLMRRDVVESSSKSPQSNRKYSNTLASVEPMLMNAALEAVIRLSSRDCILAPRESLWLSYRLYGWITYCWRSANNEDRHSWPAALVNAHNLREPREAILSHLDPMRFGLGMHNHRLSAFLAAIFVMEDAISVYREPDAEADNVAPPVQVASPRMIELLTELASTELSPIDLEMRSLDSVDEGLLWMGPVAVPDRALCVLMRHAPDRFLVLPANVRLKWLQDLSCSNEASSEGLDQELSLVLSLNLSGNISKLNSDEVDCLRNFRVRNMRSKSIAMRSAASALTVGLVSSGEISLDSVADGDLDAMLRLGLGPALSGALTEAAIANDVEGVAELIDRVVGLTRGLVRAPEFAVSMGAMLRDDDRVLLAPARDVLRKLQSNPVYSDDLGFRQMVDLLPEDSQS